MPMFGSEPRLEPEPTRTRHRFGSGFKEIIELNIFGWAKWVVSIFYSTFSFLLLIFLPVAVLYSMTSKSI